MFWKCLLHICPRVRCADSEADCCIFHLWVCMTLSTLLNFSASVSYCQITSLISSAAFQFISLGCLGIQSFQQIIIWHHPYQCLHILFPVMARDRNEGPLEGNWSDGVKQLWEGLTQTQRLRAEWTAVIATYPGAMQSQTRSGWERQMSVTTVHDVD